MGALKEIVEDQGRGVVGALVIGMPLLFTMETWHLAERLPWWIVTTFGLGGLAVILAVVRVTGFRSDEGQPQGALAVGRQFAEVVLQCLIAGLAFLWLFGIIDTGTSLTTVTRLALIEMVPLGLGAAAANSLLKSGDDPAEPRPFPQNIGIFAFGAMVFSISIAPTQEVIVALSMAGPLRLAAIIIVTLGLTYMALYEVELRGQQGRSRRHVYEVGETFMLYAVGAVIAAASLLGYGHVWGHTFETVMQSIVVLTVPASMGAAAARVIL